MPPPPPQTPDPEHKPGQPLQERPGQKAGDFVERDLWNLDEAWDEGGRAGRPAKQDPPPEDPAGDPASPAAEDTDQAREDEPVETGDPGDPGDDTRAATDQPDEEPRDAAETTDSAGDADPGEQEDPASDPELQPELGEDDETGQPDGEQAAPASGPAHQSGTMPGDDLSLDSESAPVPQADPAPAIDDAAATSDTSNAPDTTAKDIGDEFQDLGPKPEPKGPPKSKRLSTLELVSLAIVLMVILAGAGWALKTFFADIPTRKTQVPVPDFPARGELISIESAASFWREPIRSGPDPDTARRDAKLIPALELKIKKTKGDGALRVFFRDESGQLVGDSVTHAFRNGVFVTSGNDQLQLAATAGFDDEGKHAAYQTGQTELWTIEVFEGPEERAAFETFKLLFEMPVSPERR